MDGKNSAQAAASGGLSSKLAERPIGEMQERFTQALDYGANEVFDMMVGVPLGPSTEATQPPAAEYTAMIGLAGDICGVLSFRCSTASAKLIAGKMLGSTDDVADSSVRDALGEICNMVAGSFKGQLSDLAERCMLSVPTVVSGRDYQMYPLVDGLRIQISKTFEGALTWFTVDLHSS